MFPISLSPTIWRSPEYDNQNLNIQVTQLLENNPQFIQLNNMYQYYKIKAVALKTIPQPYEGTYPPVAWAYLLGNNDMTINYSSIPRLPGAKLIPNNKTTTRYFKRVGRQHDFNWYNDGPNPQSNFDIRIRFSEAPTRAAYVLQVKVFLVFSMMIDASSNKNNEDCNFYIDDYKKEEASLESSILTHSVTSFDNLSVSSQQLNFNNVKKISDEKFEFKNKSFKSKEEKKQINKKNKNIKKVFDILKASIDSSAVFWFTYINNEENFETTKKLKDTKLYKEIFAIPDNELILDWYKSVFKDYKLNKEDSAKVISELLSISDMSNLLINLRLYKTLQLFKKSLKGNENLKK
jgi:hypothetical protein